MASSSVSVVMNISYNVGENKLFVVASSPSPSPSTGALFSSFLSSSSSSSSSPFFNDSEECQEEVSLLLNNQEPSKLLNTLYSDRDLYAITTQLLLGLTLNIMILCSILISIRRTRNTNVIVHRANYYHSAKYCRIPVIDIILAILTVLAIFRLLSRPALQLMCFYGICFVTDTFCYAHGFFNTFLHYLYLWTIALFIQDRYTKHYKAHDYICKCSHFVLYITLVCVMFLTTMHFCAPIYGFSSYRFLFEEVTCSIDWLSRYSCAFYIYSMLFVAAPALIPLLYWITKITIRQVINMKIFNRSRNCDIDGDEGGGGGGGGGGGCSILEKHEMIPTSIIINATENNPTTITPPTTPPISINQTTTTTTTTKCQQQHHDQHNQVLHLSHPVCAGSNGGSEGSGNAGTSSSVTSLVYTCTSTCESSNSVVEAHNNDEDDVEEEEDKMVQTDQTAATTTTSTPNATPTTSIDNNNSTGNKSSANCRQQQTQTQQRQTRWANSRHSAKPIHLLLAACCCTQNQHQRQHPSNYHSHYHSNCNRNIATTTQTPTPTTMTATQVNNNEGNHSKSLSVAPITNHHTDIDIDTVGLNMIELKQLPSSSSSPPTPPPQPPECSTTGSINCGHSCCQNPHHPHNYLQNQSNNVTTPTTAVLCDGQKNEVFVVHSMPNLINNQNIGNKTIKRFASPTTQQLKPSQIIGSSLLKNKKRNYLSKYTKQQIGGGTKKLRKVTYQDEISSSCSSSGGGGGTGGCGGDTKRASSVSGHPLGINNTGRSSNLRLSYHHSSFTGNTRNSVRVGGGGGGGGSSTRTGSSTGGGSSSSSAANSSITQLTQSHVLTEYNELFSVTLCAWIFVLATAPKLYDNACKACFSGRSSSSSAAAAAADSSNIGANCMDDLDDENYNNINNSSTNGTFLFNNTTFDQSASLSSLSMNVSEVLSVELSSNITAAIGIPQYFTRYHFYLMLIDEFGTCLVIPFILLFYHSKLRFAFYLCFATVWHFIFTPCRRVYKWHRAVSNSKKRKRKPNKSIINQNNLTGRHTVNSNSIVIRNSTSGSSIGGGGGGGGTTTGTTSAAIFGINDTECYGDGDNDDFGTHQHQMIKPSLTTINNHHTVGRQKNITVSAGSGVSGNEQLTSISTFSSSLSSSSSLSLSKLHTVNDHHHNHHHHRHHHRNQHQLA